MRDWFLRGDFLLAGGVVLLIVAMAIAAHTRAAKDAGYAITVHGSLNRDIDLVAVPWREHNVWSMDALLDALTGAVRGVTGRCNCERKEWTVKPHGRRAKILMAWVGETTANLDLSVMPAIEKEKADAPD
jgi:hypothetical protein